MLAVFVGPLLISASMTSQNRGTNQIFILPCEPKWAASLSQAIDQVSAEGQFFLNPTGPGFEKVAQFVQKMKEAGCPQFVAVENDNVIGWCEVRRPPNAELVDGHHSGDLGIGVLKAYRGQGLGRALMNAAIRESWARGFSRIGLTVFVENESAIQLYEKFGFERGEILKNHAQIHGQFRDSLAMALIRR